jgi:hypothetical protein
MSAAVERGMRSAGVDFALEVLDVLDREGVLKCSLDDAKKLFDFDSVAVVSSRSKASKKRESGKSKSKITAKPTVILPFCGDIQDDWCKGVKLNHGLHSQCTNGEGKEDIYCKTCRKHADNSATGKPPYGDINDRSKFTVDYRDPKGKLTVPYANVAEKLGINLETANAAAATLGWTIPAEQLVKRVSKKGRPAKSTAVSDSDSDDETPKKKRGRPSKAKAAEPTQDDQIAQLVAEAYAETTAVKKIKVKKVVSDKLKSEKKEAAAKIKADKVAANLAKKEAAAKLKADKVAANLAKKEAAAKLKADKVAANLAKKEASDKLKAEKKEASDKLKAEKKEASDKLKAEKKEASDKLKADKIIANIAKKEASEKMKEEKLVAKALEKEAKEAAADKVKSEKKALALKVRQEKAATKKAEREAAKIRKKEAASKLKAEVDDAAEDVCFPELEEEAVDSSDNEEADSSDDEEEEIVLSNLPIKIVDGNEYRVLEQDGQTILLSKQGEAVGVYDADTDSVQEAEFEEE